MLKKVISLFVLFTGIILISNTAVSYAYSTDKYSIEVPDSYKETSEGSFSNENGNSINIIINRYTYNSADPYTEKNLNEIVNEFEESSKDEFINAIKQELKKYDISEEDIEEYVNNIKIDINIKTKEISTITSDKYKCFHILTQFTIDGTPCYTDQYCTISNKDMFIITVTADDMKYFNTSEALNMVNSLKINNYKEPSGSSSKFLTRLIIAAAGGAIIGLIAAIISRITKRNKDKAIEQNVNSNVDMNLNSNVNGDYDKNNIDYQNPTEQNSDRQN